MRQNRGAFHLLRNACKIDLDMYALTTNAKHIVMGLKEYPLE